MVLPVDWACGQDFCNDQEIKVKRKRKKGTHTNTTRRVHPLHDIAIPNIVWCMAYTRGVGGRACFAQKMYNSITILRAMQVRGCNKRMIDCAQKPRSKTISCKGQKARSGEPARYTNRQTGHLRGALCA